MKKSFFVILCLALLMGSLTSCTSAAYKNMGTLLDDMSEITEGDIALSMTIKGYDEAELDLLKWLRDNEYSGFTANGSISYEKQQAQLSIDLDYIDESDPTLLTDIALDGDDKYVKMSSIVDVFVSGLDAADSIVNSISDYFDSAMDSKEYIYSEQPSTWDKINESKELLTNLNSTLHTALKNLNSVTYNNGTYTISLEGKKLNTVLTAIYTQIKDNAEGCASCFVSLLSGINTSALDLTIPEESELADNILKQMDERLAELEAETEENNKSLTITLSFDEETGVYTQKVDYVLDDQDSISIEYSVSEKEINEIVLPENYIDYDDFNTKTENSSGIISGRTRAFKYETVTSESISSFVRHDLDGYNDLNSYEVKTDSGETYSVPMIQSDKINTYNHLTAVESPGMWQYYIYYERTENVTARSTIVSQVSENYDYTTYGFENPSNSNLYISSDATKAAMSFTYDDSTYGMKTMIYVAMETEDGKNILLMEIHIYHEYMEESDHVIVSQLSEILGVDLTEFYSVG